MKAEIKSKDELKETRGVTLTVSSDQLSVSTSKRFVTVRASENEVICSAALSGSGPVQDITRELTLKLSPADMTRILDAALKANLLRVTFGATKPRPK